MLRSFSSLQGARFGDPVHADVANGPRIGISAVFGSVRSLRDGDCGSAPDPEDSQIWSAIDGCVDDCRTSQPHFRVGYGWFFIDALMVMLLAVIYLLLTRRQSHRANRECGTAAPI